MSQCLQRPVLLPLEPLEPWQMPHPLSTLFIHGGSKEEGPWGDQSHIQCVGSLLGPERVVNGRHGV